MIGQTHGLSLRDERGAQGEIRVRIAGIELDTEAFGSPHSRRGTFIDRLHLQMRVARTISIALAGTDSLDVIGDQADQTADPCGVLWHASGGQSNIKLAGIVIFCGAGACAKGIDAHVATYIAAFAVLAIGSTEPTAALEQLVGGAAASAGPTERQTVAAGNSLMVVSSGAHVPACWIVPTSLGPASGLHDAPVNVRANITEAKTDFVRMLMWTPFVTPTTSLCEACGPVILRICGMAVGLPEEYGLSATCRKACSPNAAAHRVAPRRFRVQGNLPGQNDRNRCLTSTSRAW